VLPGVAERSARRWRWATVAAVVLGLVWRVGYVLAFKHPATIQGDAFYYHYGANLFADGKGFPDPYAYRLAGLLQPKAQHPPLYLVVLGLGSLIGLRSYLSHQLVSCVLGAATVAVVGRLGWRLGGPRVGFAAALLSALYPMLWLNDALVLSESLSTLLAACTALAAYRFAQRPSVREAVVLGGTVALAALARAELLLLVVALVLPMVLQVPASWRRRLGLLLAAGVACLAVLSPWAAYNAARFRQPALLGTSLGPTLLVANCPSTWSGPFKGWWDYSCIISTPQPPGDASEQDVAYRHLAEDFVAARKGQIPGEIAARVGRVWGVYHPDQQLRLDRIETRELPASRVGLGMYYGLVLGSLAGVVVLRRRRVPLLPLLAPLLVVTVSAAAFYGTTRFRASAEPSLVILACVGIGALLARSRRSPAAEPPAADAEPVLAGQVQGEA